MAVVGANPIALWLLLLLLIIVSAYTARATEEIKMDKQQENTITTGLRSYLRWMKIGLLNTFGAIGTSWVIEKIPHLSMKKALLLESLFISYANNSLYSGV